jgi:hypothetical protein
MAEKLDARSVEQTDVLLVGMSAVETVVCSVAPTVAERAADLDDWMVVR